MMGEFEARNRRTERIELLVGLLLHPGYRGQLHNHLSPYPRIELVGRFPDEKGVLIDDPVEVIFLNDSEVRNVALQDVAQGSDVGVHSHDDRRKFLLDLSIDEELSEGIDGSADAVLDSRGDGIHRSQSGRGCATGRRRIGSGDGCIGGRGGGGGKTECRFNRWRDSVSEIGEIFPGRFRSRLQLWRVGAIRNRNKRLYIRLKSRQELESALNLLVGHERFDDARVIDRLSCIELVYGLQICPHEVDGVGALVGCRSLIDNGSGGGSQCGAVLGQWREATRREECQ